MASHHLKQNILNSCWIKLMLGDSVPKSLYLWITLKQKSLWYNGEGYVEILRSDNKILKLLFYYY